MFRPSLIHDMLVRIGSFEFTECWDGVLYKKLSAYPDITEWEIQNILDFATYEKNHGRECSIDAAPEILRAISAYGPVYRSGVRLDPPRRITECTACPVYRGCMTDFVCHTAPVENAEMILRCGSLKAPVLWRGLTVSELAAEARNAAKDPPDYFEYVMFAWGNCQAGDRLVMERKLGRFPDETDLSVGFTPGVRFFFRYMTLASHPDAVFDGVLPVKVKNEVVLKDLVHAIIVPSAERDRLENAVPEDLKTKVYYVDNDSADIWEWSQKVYEFIKAI